MGFLDRLFKRKERKHDERELQVSNQIDSLTEEGFIEETRLIEETAEETQVEELEGEPRYLKVIHLYGLSDVTLIQKELEKRNIIILDVSLLKNTNGSVTIELKRAVDQLRGIIRSIDGDIGLLSDRFIIVTPKGLKIWRRKEDEEDENKE
ncbi:MAG: cell division protein SepF [Candidatus Odinarchaeia archaeon]